MRSAGHSSKGQGTHGGHIRSAASRFLLSAFLLADASNLATLEVSGVVGNLWIIINSRRLNSDSVNFATLEVSDIDEHLRMLKISLQWNAGA